VRQICLDQLVNRELKTPRAKQPELHQWNPLQELLEVPWQDDRDYLLDLFVVQGCHLDPEHGFGIYWFF
jgi:hypothetical protein